MPNTIAQNLARLVTARTDIANAITAKGGAVTSGDGFEEFPADIATIPSGGGSSVKSKAVNFYDYDGTIVHSYTADEFAELSEMPSNPTHEGLTAQGWNWTLANAKSYVSKYRRLNIGQVYITSDGKTRLYIHMTKGRTTPNLQLYLNPNTELDIDWGDGSPHSTFSTTSAGYVDEYHTYPETEGNYVIAVAVRSGGFYLQSSSNNTSSILWDKKNNANSPDRAYANSIQRIEIGSNVTAIGKYAFYNCFSLTNITIPNSVTSIETYAFYNCLSLTNITIPNSVTSIEKSTFQSCSSLVSVRIPNSVTSIETYAFYNCFSLTNITIPNSVISIVNYAFYNCLSLTNITIPNSVTSIETYAFYNCYSLPDVTIPNSVTSIETYAFYNCLSLTNITIPNSVTSIEKSTFQSCSSLVSVRIPNSVTSIETYAFNNCYCLTDVTIPDKVTSIGNNAFYGCYSLANVTIPDKVTSIGTYAFRDCSYMDYIKFKKASPTTISSSNTFQNLSTTTLIIVPVNCLQAYTTATNYPSSATYTYLVSGTYTSGVTLPTTSTDNYRLTWYATINDARNQTSPITQGNGKEVYARGVAV